MAERRMFSKTIIDSDAFLDMPLSTQALYFHLSMRADDDGFVNNPRKIQRMIGSSDDDLKLLMVKQFLIAFESGVVVIKHWKIHNYIRNDRYKPTIYQDERKQLEECESKAYELGIPNGYQMDTQVRLGKVSLGESSLGEVSIEEEPLPSAPAPDKPTRHKYGFYKNVLLSDEDMEKLKSEFPHDWEQRIERLSEYIASKGAKYKNHLATIRAWARKEVKPDATHVRRNSSNHVPVESGVGWNKIL